MVVAEDQKIPPESPILAEIPADIGHWKVNYPLLLALFLARDVIFKLYFIICLVNSVRGMNTR